MFNAFFLTNVLNPILFERFQFVSIRKRLADDLVTLDVILLFSYF